MEEKEELEKLHRNIKELTREVKDLEKELKMLNQSSGPQKLSFEDIVQELAGATVVALTISLSEEIWDIAKKLSLVHILFVYLFVLLVANIFVRYGNQKQWVKQTLLGFIQLRLLTSAFLSLVVSLFVVVLLGIYPNMVGDLNDLFKVVILVSSFSLIGSLGLDMAK